MTPLAYGSLRAPPWAALASLHGPMARPLVDAVPDAPPAEGVRVEVLPSGLTVLLREVHVAPVVEVQVWARVGAADERPGEEGLAHFHEHMLFKGTERRGVGEIAGAVEGVGGRINAYTSYDSTVYHVTLPADELAAGVDVLADAVQNSVFEPDEVAREVEVVLEEIRRSDDSPHHVLADLVFATAFRAHPYRAPILGSRESVRSFTREKVRAFFERWYAAENFAVVLAGDFRADAALPGVERAFAGARRGGARRARPAEPTQHGVRTALLRRPFERACLELAWPAVAFSHPDAPHLDLLAFILGEGESSRLARRVKDRERLGDRLDAACWTPLDPGIFGVSADLEAEQALPLLEALAREVETLRLEPVTQAELEKARANFLAVESWERESVSGVARKLGSFHVIAGDHRLEARYLDAVRSARPEDLLRVARDWLGEERACAAAVLPQDDAPGLGAPALGAALAAGAAAARRRLARPALRERRSDVHAYALESGARIYVVQRRDVPVVAARVALLGGLLAETGETAGIGSFLASMWLRGTRGRSGADFAREVEGLASDLDGFSGRNSTGLTLEVTSDRLLPSLDLLAEALLEPALAPEEIEKERAETLAALERREDQLGARAFDLFADAHFRSHPYRLPLGGTPEAVKALGREALLAHQARLVDPRHLVVGLVGDVDPDDVAAECAKRLGGLAAPPGDPWLPPPAEPAPDAAREVELRKERAQAHVVIGCRGLAVGDPDREALEVLTQLLSGQGGRLFLELRDRRSLAYSVSALNVEGLAPGFFAVYIATAPEKLGEARRGLLEQLEAARQAPPEPAELERARRYLVGSFAIDQQRAAVRASHLALDPLYALPPDADRRYAERVRAVTRDDVLRVARRILQLELATTAVIRGRS
jgi:zinc protease